MPDALSHAPKTNGRHPNECRSRAEAEGAALAAAGLIADDPDLTAEFEEALDAPLIAGGTEAGAQLLFASVEERDAWRAAHGFPPLTPDLPYDDGYGNRFATKEEACKSADQEYRTRNGDDARPLRLNVGAGGVHLAGFVNVDRDDGGEAYPLAVADESVEEILASHVLEHFSHRQAGEVLAHWVAKLKPGGKIRLAVPDFEELARLYLEGHAVNVQGYVMGGHCDENDRHGCLFDREALTELMLAVGLERIGPWVSDVPGCSSGPHSLNLMGFKPGGPTTSLAGVRACMSVPRFGPLLHPRCAEKAFRQLRINVEVGQSCFWHQKLSCQMEEAVADPACEFVLTMDFDTVFSAHDVLELHRLLVACPDVDAVFPLQSKRGCEEALFSIAGRKPGTCKTAIAAADLTRHLLPANTGHFGLTLFRADSLRKHKRPWMVPTPNQDGLWSDGHTDADIDFWKRFRAAGFTACLAPRVVVGHLEEVVKWPGKDLRPVYQTTGDYEDDGIPAEVLR